MKEEEGGEASIDNDSTSAQAGRQSWLLGSDVDRRNVRNVGSQMTSGVVDLWLTSQPGIPPQRAINRTASRAIQEQSGRGEREGGAGGEEERNWGAEGVRSRLSADCWG